MTTTLQIRIDSKMKKRAQSVFENMGLDLSSGVKLYLAQVITEQALPFIPRTENGYTSAFEARMLRQAAQAKKNGKRYATVEEAMKDIFR